jgi:hypothetical protein
MKDSLLRQAQAEVVSPCPLHTAEIGENYGDTGNLKRKNRIKNLSLAALAFGAFFVFFNFLLAENYYFEIKIKNVVPKSESRPVSQLFYDTGAGWRESDSTHAKVKHGFYIDYFNKISFRLPSKKMERFRVDLRNEAFHVNIRDVEITKKTFFDGYVVKLTDFPLENFNFYNEDILAHEIQGNTLTIQTKPDVSDPFFILTPPTPVLFQESFLSKSAWWLSGILAALVSFLLFRSKQFVFRMLRRVDFPLLNTSDSASGTLLFKVMTGALVGICLLSIPLRVRFAPLSVFVIPAIIYILVAFFFSYPLLKQLFAKAETRKLFVFALAVAVATYWYWLTNFILSIDKELNLLDPFCFVHVPDQRWGSAILSFLLPVTFSSLPFLPSVLFCVGLSIASVILAITFSTEKKWQFLFCALFVSAPNWPHIAHNICSPFIGFGLVFASLSVRQYCFSSNLATLFSAFVLLVLSFGFYQSFFFYFLVASLFLILFVEGKSDELFLTKMKVKIISILRLVLFCSLTAGVSFGMSKLLHLWTNAPTSERISKMFHIVNATDTGGLFLQLKLAVNQILYILLGMDKMFIGHGMSSLFIFWFGLLALFFYEPQKVKSFLFKGVSLFCVGSVVFILVFIMGSVTIRTLFSFAILYAFSGACASKSKSVFVAIIAVVGVLTNIYICTANFTNDSIARERDKVFANSLISEMRLIEPKLCEREVNFTVIGAHKHEDLVFTPNYNVFGGSFFEWDGGNPYRIQHYLRYLGIANLSPVLLSDEDIDILNNEKYPIFPAKGSVFYYKGVLVVKLGKTTRENMNVLREVARLIIKDTL